MIRAIAAIDRQRGIAKSGQISWHIPSDGRYFHDQTAGALSLMGRGTADMLEPKPNHEYLVITHHPENLRSGFKHLTQKLDDYLAKAAAPGNTGQDVWIIGGAQVYAETLAYCQELYLTQIDTDADCDQFLPDFHGKFKLAQAGPWQQENGYKFRYTIWRRR